MQPLNSNLSSPDSAPVYTPTSQFFHHPTRQQPHINRDYWALMLAGLVDMPLVLPYDELLALPADEITCTLACGGNTPGGQLISTAAWRGVRLSTLLAQVSAGANARYVRFYAADGYTSSLPIDHAPYVLLAHTMNGQSLTPEHGFPLRAIAPGLSGYKLPRWLRRVELAATPSLSIWEKQGWPVAGEAQPYIAITSHRNRQTVHGTITLAGTAYGGANDLTRITLSPDLAPPMPVTFARPDRHIWVQWAIDWLPPAPGAYQITAQAVTSAATAQHSITLNVQP